MVRTSAASVARPGSRLACKTANLGADWMGELLPFPSVRILVFISPMRLQFVHWK